MPQLSTNLYSISSLNSTHYTAQPLVPSSVENFEIKGSKILYSQKILAGVLFDGTLEKKNKLLDINLAVSSGSYNYE